MFYRQTNTTSVLSEVDLPQVNFIQGSRSHLKLCMHGLPPSRICCLPSRPLHTFRIAERSKALLNLPTAQETTIHAGSIPNKLLQGQITRTPTCELIGTNIIQNYSVYRGFCKLFMLSLHRNASMREEAGHLFSPSPREVRKGCALAPQQWGREIPDSFGKKARFLHEKV